MILILYSQQQILICAAEFNSFAQFPLDNSSHPIVPISFLLFLFSYFIRFIYFYFLFAKIFSINFIDYFFLLFYCFVLIFFLRGNFCSSLHNALRRILFFLRLLLPSRSLPMLSFRPLSLTLSRPLSPSLSLFPLPLSPSPYLSFFSLFLFTFSLVFLHFTAFCLAIATN